MTRAKTLMVQGTGSNVGKSWVVTALCRYFSRLGYKVAPFKSQNMALNAAICWDGGEIGRAQMVQAEACGQRAERIMNPILLKPQNHLSSQIIVLGEVHGTADFRGLHAGKLDLKGIIQDSLDTLRSENDLVIIEGAGSPAEINLKDRDIVNMYVAAIADAPVILVSDIDRGGVFASLLGTLMLLEPDERDRIAGFLVNKFRGDPSLFTDGMKLLEDRMEKPGFGLIPFFNGPGIAEEDSMGMEQRPFRIARHESTIDVAILRFPHLSNYDEFLPLEQEEGVHVAYVVDPSEAWDADLLILPGSKATIADLEWLRSRGFEEVIQERAKQSRMTLGLCGGYQMLGQSIHDPSGCELAGTSEGLKLMPHTTIMALPKITRRVELQIMDRLRTPVEGYEMHMGRIEDANKPWFEATNGAEREGFADDRALLFGSVVHGLFENCGFRLRVLNQLRAKRSLPPLTASKVLDRNEVYDRMADHLEFNCDMGAIRRLVNLEGT